MFISEIINISDPVLVFDHIMEEIEITKYLKTATYRVGRKGYNSVKWVWKKATEKSRYRLFAKITALFEKMNNELKYKGVKIQTNAEYTPEYLDEILSRYKAVVDVQSFQKRYGLL